MVHETPLITTIVAGLVLAFIFGTIANRLRLPPLVGYLLAGVVVGPYSPGFVADQALALELSEIGVILLMFGVGLNFSLKDLVSVQALAIPGALGRMAAGTAMGAGLALLMGMSLFAGIIFGLALSVASTVVLLKALQDRHLMDTDRGRIAVGWVIVEDIAMILALVLIPAFAGVFNGAEAVPADPFVSFIERVFRIELGVPGIVAVSLIKLAAFVGFMLIVGRRLIPMLLHFVAHSGSRELFRLAVLAIALGVAAGSAYLFGVSLALGAFFAGMILSESELSHRAAQETLPLRDAFAVLFFVAVGMLFDPMIVVRSPLPVLGVLFIILIGKSAVAFLIIRAFRRPIGTALTISASLAQVGEFSFILASLGIVLGILPPEGRDLIVAGAIVSIVLNPLMFFLADRLRPRLEARMGGQAAALDGPEPLPEPGDGGAAAATPAPVAHATTQAGHAVLVGYGRVGRVIAEGLLRARTPFLVIEDADSRVAAAHAAGIEVVVGNAARSEVLRLANVAGAQSLLVAIPNAFEAGQAAEQGRRLNPRLRIIARAHSDEEELHLAHLGADRVIMGEREVGLGMLASLADAPLQAAFAGGTEPANPPDLPVEPPAGVRLAPAENILARALPEDIPAAAEVGATAAGLPPIEARTGVGREPTAFAAEPMGMTAPEPQLLHPARGATDPDDLLFPAPAREDRMPTEHAVAAEEAVAVEPAATFNVPAGEPLSDVPVVEPPPETPGVLAGDDGLMPEAAWENAAPELPPDQDPSSGPGQPLEPLALLHPRDPAPPLQTFHPDRLTDSMAPMRPAEPLVPIAPEMPEVPVFPVPELPATDPAPTEAPAQTPEELPAPVPDESPAPHGPDRADRFAAPWGEANPPERNDALSDFDHDPSGHPAQPARLLATGFPGPDPLPPELPDPAPPELPDELAHYPTPRPAAFNPEVSPTVDATGGTDDLFPSPPEPHLPPLPPSDQGVTAEAEAQGDGEGSIPPVRPEPRV